MYSVIAFDGQVYGPVDVNTLILWCQQGRIVAGTHLVETLSGRTFIASDMPELRPHLAQPQAQQGVSQQPYAPQGQGPFASPQSPYQPPFQQPYGSQTPFNPYANPGQQYYGVGGVPKSKSLALFLCFLFGGLGVHRFYLGLTNSGIAMLIVGILAFAFCPLWAVVIIWTTVDFFAIVGDKMRDAQGVVPR